MTSYVSMTSYPLSRPGLVTLWDFIVNIGQQQNVGQGKSYWLSGPYNCAENDPHVTSTYTETDVSG